MKLVIIIYDSGIEESIDAVVQELALPGYTKLFGAHGLGGQGPKLATVVWPGDNSVLLVALEEDRVPALLARLRQLQAEFRVKPGITVLALPAEQL